MAKIKLDLDMESLFPGKSVDICGKQVDIIPLGVWDLASVLRKVKGFGESLGKDGVTWDNYADPENMVKIAGTVMEQFPSVLSDASNIEEEDLKLLPLAVIVEILDKVIEVNLESRESLEKNFKSLAGKFKMIPTGKKPSSRK